MNCRRAKTLIYDFIDGMIGDQDRVTLEEHLGECQSCEYMATSLSKSLDLLHGVPQMQPSDNFNWKVRLGITHARNVVADGASNERAWLRSWNIRFVMSAAATFVVVAATGYFLTQSSIVPDLDRGASTPELAAKADLPPSVEPKADQPKETRTFYDPSFGAGSPIQSQPVVTNSQRPNGASGPLIGEVTFDADSLASHFTRSRISEVFWQHRARLLEQQVNTLRGELNKCEKDE